MNISTSKTINKNMSDSLIGISTSLKELSFQPGSSPAIFEVNVINYSDKFASFQLEIIAAGVEGNLKHNWYVLSPEISSKKPPGDSTKFVVQIIDTPVPGFVGQVNLTVQVFSIELQEENRQLLRLTVLQGLGEVALRLKLPIEEFQAYPDQQIKIPVQLENPGQKPANVILHLLGIEPAWLYEEKHSLHIPAGDRIETAFLCQIPAPTKAFSQVYHFTIEAIQPSGLSSKIQGNLSILPKGEVNFRCNPKQHRIPRNYLSFRSEPVNYQLELENYSNLDQICRVVVNTEEKVDYQVLPEEINLQSGMTNQLSLETKVKRPWFGREKNLLIEVASELSDQRLGNTEPPNHTIKLKILPLIPIWLLAIILILLSGVLWWLSWLNPSSPFFGHKKAVNSVQFNGLVDDLISGSNDQRTILWRVDGFFNPIINQEIRQISNSQKAVRVVRYRPVNNNVMAAGLENGEIQLWRLTQAKDLIGTLSYQKDDRVLGLEFTPDSQFLFSAHGSGLVLVWDTTYTKNNRNFTLSERLLEKKQFDFAIYDIRLFSIQEKQQSDSLLNVTKDYLAIVGRYNQLAIWDLSQDKIMKVPYPIAGGQDDYIVSLDTAEMVPLLLATADNQGYITIWDLEKCIQGKGKCEIRDRWLHNKPGESVRSISLSYNACYLASGGDDSKVRLWALTSDGKRAQEKNGEYVTKEVDRSIKKEDAILSVDVKLAENDVLIASGSEDTQVRVKTEKRRRDLNCDIQTNQNNQN